ncbi:MAG: dethiobiotin synthase [Solirubrobacterales bacterium]
MPDSSGGSLTTTPGIFVTGTGTGVGKSIVAACIVAALAARGHRVAAFKPVVTGLDEPDETWPTDHVLLSRSSGWQRPDDVTPFTFGPAVSPHLAAQLADSNIDRAVVLEALDRAADEAEVVVCEGVGGLLVPLSSSPPFSVLDLIVQCALPVVVAARPGLGTISDTRLTVDRLRAEGVSVLAVVLTPWPAQPNQIELSNRATIEELCEVAVYGLPPAAPETLAERGADLPVEQWLGLAIPPLED